MSRFKAVQFSSSSDDDEADKGLAHELQAAVAREEKKNPHALGRAKVPVALHERTQGVSKAKDLFASSSSGSDSSDDDDNEAKTNNADPDQDTLAVKRSSKVPSKSENAPSRAAHKKETDEEVQLRINASYAQKFEEVKRKQELQRLTEKFEKKHGKRISFDEVDLDDGEDEEDEEDDDAVLLTQEKELAFAKALLAVRKAAVVAGKKNKKSTATKEKTGTKPGTSSTDAKVGKGDNETEDGEGEEDPLKTQERFFPPADEQVERNTEVFTRAIARKRLERKAKDAGFTLTDEYQRALHATADGEDTYMPPEAEEVESSGLRKLRPQTAEERRLRAAFLASVKDEEGGEEDGLIMSKTGNTSAMAIPGAHTGGGRPGLMSSRGSQEDAEREAAKKLLEQAFTIGQDEEEEEDVEDEQGASHDDDDEDGTSTDAPTPKPRRKGRKGRRDEEQFLQQFFLKELWRSHGDGSGDDANGGDGDEDGDEDSESGGAHPSRYHRMAQLAKEEEDEIFYEDAEQWEREYQEKKYRHEEEEAQHIATYPRPVGDAAEGLLRKHSTARKDARQRRRERLEDARQRQSEELKRLKHLKRQEIDEQRALIASVAGLVGAGGEKNKKRSKNKYAMDDDEDEDASGRFGGDAEEDRALARLKEVWSEKDMEADFDPAEFDKKMAMLFDDDYYDENNVNEDEMAYFETEKDLEDNELILGLAGAEDEDVDEDDDDDDEEEEGEGEGEEDATRGVRAIAKQKRRALAAALTEEPDLFRVQSLDEAKKLAAASAHATDNNAKKGKANKKGDAEDEDVTAALLASTGAGGLFGMDELANVGDLDDDEDEATWRASAHGGNSRSRGDGALYPSSSAATVSDKTPKLVEKKREIDALMQQYEALSKKVSEDHEEEGVESDDDHHHKAKGKSAEPSNETEATLARLQAELKQKEDEYDQLHHESIIGGGTIKARFRYREVPAEDFTLSVEDILARDDRQLNMIAPMSCYAAYLDKRSNLRDRSRIERRLQKGFREVGPERASRRYGDLQRTVVFDPNMDEEQGEAIVRNLSKRLREEEEEVVVGDAHKAGAAAAPAHDGVTHARGGTFRGRDGFRGGSRGAGGFTPRGRGGRGGGEWKQPRTEAGRGGRGSFRGAGGRGRGGPHRGRGA